MTFSSPFFLDSWILFHVTEASAGKTSQISEKNISNLNQLGLSYMSAAEPHNELKHKAK
jgi:hypothetical protein